MDSQLTSNQASPNEDRPRLKRTLGLWELVVYGIVLIQPVAAVGIFGIATIESKGHLVTALLIAMFGMMLTAVSYGRMATVYPSAGSAYTYIGKGLNPNLGFLAGWAMFLDYLIVPVINTIYAALTLQRLLPEIPYMAWVIVIVLIISAVNLRGIRTTAWSNEILLVIMILVIGMFFIMASRFIIGQSGWESLFTMNPLFDHHTFALGSVLTATSLAALTYIGFDGVTVLAEDVKKPASTLLWAPVLVCLITGLFSILQVYLAQLAWPDFLSFRNPETAFYDVAEKVGGRFLFLSFAFVLFIACLGSGIAAQIGAARLLFGMGRDGVISRRFFGQLKQGSLTPVNNIFFVAILMVAGAMAMNYQQAAEVLNFGAFIAFMGVNLITLKYFGIRQQPNRKRTLFSDIILPASGFLVCLIIWINLPAKSKLIGSIWLLVGLGYLVVKTNWFTRKLELDDYIEFE